LFLFFCFFFDFEAAERGDTLDDLLDVIDFKRKVEIIDLSAPKTTPEALKESKIFCHENEKVRKFQNSKKFQK
jgi:hypothetical protein